MPRRTRQKKEDPVLDLSADGFDAEFSSLVEKKKARKTKSVTTVAENFVPNDPPAPAAAAPDDTEKQEMALKLQEMMDREQQFQQQFEDLQRQLAEEKAKNAEYDADSDSTESTPANDYIESVPTEPANDATLIAERYQRQLDDMKLLVQQQAHMLSQVTQMQLQQPASSSAMQHPSQEPVLPPSPPRPELSWPAPVDEASNTSMQDSVSTNVAAPTLPPSRPDFDVAQSRREKTDRSFSEIYATDGSAETLPEQITFTDGGVGGRWGGMPQGATHIGIRTRGLFLNPTLQQPSVGGLI